MIAVITPTGWTASPRLGLASLLVAAQAVVLLVLAGVELASVDAERPTVAVTTALFYLLFAAGLALVARGLLRASRWSRGPAVLVQLIALGVGWSFRDGATVWVTVLLALWAAVVLAIVLSPSATSVLYGGSDADPDFDAGDGRPDTRAGKRAEGERPPDAAGS